MAGQLSNPSIVEIARFGRVNLSPTKGSEFNARKAKKYSAARHTEAQTSTRRKTDAQHALDNENSTN